CDVRGYEVPADDGLGYEDLQWLGAHAVYRAPDAALSADLHLWTTDVCAFASGLSRALTQRGGEARFDTMEQQLWLVLALDPRGRAQVDGELRQMPGMGTWVHFQFTAGTTDVERLLMQTQETCRA